MYGECPDKVTGKNINMHINNNAYMIVNIFNNEVKCYEHNTSIRIQIDTNMKDMACSVLQLQQPLKKRRRWKRKRKSRTKTSTSRREGQG